MTHVGRVRNINEDAYLEARKQGLWVVADGMGGHSSGDVASRTVIKSLLNFSRRKNLPASIDNLEDRLFISNSACRKYSAGKKVMGSTVALLFAHDTFCFFMWVGDSRIYRLRGGKLTRVTEDHSLVQEMCALGEISEEEAAVHPSSNIITRAIGVRHELFVDIEYSTVESGDRFLVCSDGLYKDIRDGEICELLSCKVSVDKAVKNLMGTALERGGSDNITIIVVQAEGT
jgi:protein phosphatase